MRIVADRRANLADELRQTRLGNERGGPDGGVEISLRERLRAVLDQKLEERERFRRDVDGFVPSE